MSLMRVSGVLAVNSALKEGSLHGEVQFMSHMTHVSIQVTSCTLTSCAVPLSWLPKYAL